MEVRVTSLENDFMPDDEGEGGRLLLSEPDSAGDARSETEAER